MCWLTGNDGFVAVQPTLMLLPRSQSTPPTQQVLHSAVRGVEAVAVWEASGRQGPEPRYQLLALPGSQQPPAAPGQPVGRPAAVGKAPASVCFECCKGVHHAGKPCCCFGNGAAALGMLGWCWRGDVCSCLQPSCRTLRWPADAAGQLWTCHGACRRTFHHACRQPGGGSSTLVRRCEECASNRREGCAEQGRGRGQGWRAADGGAALRFAATSSQLGPAPHLLSVMPCAPAATPALRAARGQAPARPPSSAA